MAEKLKTLQSSLFLVLVLRLNIVLRLDIHVVLRLDTITTITLISESKVVF